MDTNKEYKVLNWGKFQVILTIIALFIPMPIMRFTPDYGIMGYGFGYSIALNRHIPLGWVIIAVTLII
jgi:hypothetical protein